MKLKLISEKEYDEKFEEWKCKFVRDQASEQTYLSKILGNEQNKGILPMDEREA